MKSLSAWRRASFAAGVSGVLVVGLGTSYVPSVGAMAAGSPPTGLTTGAGGGHTPDRSAPDKTAYDARAGVSTSARAALQRQASKAASRPAAESLRSSLGTMAVVDMDGFTGTVRQVARLDGFLTAPSSRPAPAIAMGYVREHLAALGLKSADLRTFRFRQDYVDIAGTHHLSWTQTAGGLTLFGNGLQASVTKRGQLLTLGGAPVSGLTAPPAGRTAIDNISAAIAAARADVGEPRTAGPEDTAKQVLFATPTGTRRAWQTITMSAERPLLSVLDTANGRVLYRQDLNADAASGSSVRTAASPALAAVARQAKHTYSTGTAYRYFPGHKPGGKQGFVNFTKRGWLGNKAQRLYGNNTHTYADINDDNEVNPREEIAPRSPHKWNYELKPFHLPQVSFCDNPYPCSWNPNKPYSWQVNRNQNATQVFFFVNRWHDHLLDKPIGFNAAAGNFQRVNTIDKGIGHDAVISQTDDGANTGTGADKGLPDGDHIDNANMATPPDGHSPRMQMYLQHVPHTPYGFDGDPFAPTNVGDEADTVYHEYTHGLSNRLVVDANGHSTLGPVQAGSMGEAWSDWYAMDYLVAQHVQRDRARSGDVVLFQYDGLGVFLDRTEPIDCAVGEAPKRCTGGATGHTGGYTYADYGKVIGAPEVHSDGEIWAQTLWDLRNRVGHRVSESLVTRAMELSPANPSFLDERNAILLADMAVYGGHHQHGIWRVFAHRGMGYFAGALSGNDTSPGASFAMPPQNFDVGSLRGVVTNADTGLPLKGVRITIAFQGSPFVTNPSTRTDANGRYSLGPVPVGRYPKVLFSKRGYDSKIGAVRVHAGTTQHDVQMVRDWASSAGGATIVDFTGPDYSPYNCGPDKAIDQSDAYGWSTTADLAGGQVSDKTPKSITIQLPVAINLTKITV
ncbi:MAG: M36 family metallopeptidase, partial [Propionibacteriales bacterium]|nr:M36 family metallopeptidase [Propionibacteriales bacterium]